MNRIITTEETDKLFEFCCEQKVKHYDLQLELVDHLASSMEEQWEKQPELTFDLALQKSFKKFGYKGFRDIYKIKKKELNKKYVQIHLQFFYRFFSWPQILLTTILTFLLYEIIVFSENLKTIYFIYFGTALISLLFFYLFWFPRKLKIKIRDNTKFLLLEVLKLRYMYFFLVLLAPLNILNFVLLDIIPKKDWQTISFGDTKTQVVVGVMSFLLVCFGILFYGFSIHSSLKIKEHFTEQFPEFIK